MLDGSIIKVHQDAMRSSYDKAAEVIGASVGGLSTKIHAKVDSFGQLINILITPGQRFRRIATRYDKTPRMYLTDVMFVNILLALK